MLSLLRLQAESALLAKPGRPSCESGSLSHQLYA